MHFYTVIHRARAMVSSMGWLLAVQSTVELKLLPKIDNVAFYVPFTLRGGRRGGSRNQPDISRIFRGINATLTRLK